MQIYRASLQRAGLMLLLSCGIGGFAAAAEPAAAVDGIGHPIDADALGALRGGDSSVENNSVENNVRVDGEVTGNSAEHIVSGSNVIDGSSFGNAAGLSTVIQNSGSNVLIQNAMIVNVQFGPPDL